MPTSKLSDECLLIQTFYFKACHVRLDVSTYFIDSTVSRIHSAKPFLTTMYSHLFLWCQYAGAGFRCNHKGYFSRFVQLCSLQVIKSWFIVSRVEAPWETPICKCWLQRAQSLYNFPTNLVSILHATKNLQLAKQAGRRRDIALASGTALHLKPCFFISGPCSEQ